jgi:SAM-dependent methyltransferase
VEDVAPDGSPVEIYRLLPARGEGEIVAGAIEPGATVLELGCGAGRITRQLVERGLRVTAVDESAAMLAHVTSVETVLASIEGLDLGRRFDAVLLASNLLTAEPEKRRAFLATCRRHADRIIVETLPLGWLPREGTTALGELVSRLRIDRIEGGVVHGAVTYEAHGHTFPHAFAMRVFADEPELAGALAEAGLRLDRWLDRARGWFVAV